MLRFAIAALTRDRPMSVEKVAWHITRQIERNETARRDRWRKKGLRAPAKRAE
jgi:hypothetical protein